MTVVCLSVLTLIQTAGFDRRAEAQDRAAALEHFEKRVRPLFIERCHKCHASEKAKGGLRLDSAEAIRRGGESGPVLVPGKPEESRLIQAIRHQGGLKMPPDGKLTEAQIADLVQWIKSGADWSADTTSARATPEREPSELPAAQPNDGAFAKSLQLWLRADDLTLPDGEAVFVWPDHSGHGRDMSATKGVRPEGVGLPARFVKASTLQRRPAVRFDPTTGFAASPHNPLAIRGDAELTILLVLNLQSHDAQPPYDGVIGIGNPANPTGDPGQPLAALVQINRGEDHALHFAGGWNHDASLGAGWFKPFYGKSIILSVTKRPGPIRSTTRFFLNGELANKSPDAPLDGRDTVPDIQHRMDIGAYMGKALSWSGSIRGDVGEVVVFNKALTDPERRSIEVYLADKFAIVLASQRAAVRATFTADETQHWAYQPVRDPPPPTVKNESWLKSPLDRFILHALERRQLAPTAPADRRTLLRRVTFDLTGLPATPDEVAAFLQDESPQAFAKVVNRLLDSPHYGERWGRHWLDVVRYADTTANDANAVMRYAWRYRNYVIDAFHRDLPYDQFIVEQLAGDLLPPTDDFNARIRRMTATGYLMVGPKALAETDKEQSRLDIVDDQIDVTGRAFLGLTIACARCHDHKFDAVRTVDYYALAGIFRSTEPFQDEVRNASMWWESPLFQAPGEKPFVVMAPQEALPRNLRVHRRGNRFTLGQLVPRGFVQVIDQVGSRNLPATAVAAASPIELGSGRLELARWIAGPHNPLTARVMVNRIWQHHFGQGLVATSDNFGVRGDRPTHPELLDWLAARFVENGWSMKAMHRLILLSSTYQQAARSPAADTASDADPRWLSAFPRRRLSAEELRDAVLAVSGRLDREPGADEGIAPVWEKADRLDDKRGFRTNSMAANDRFYSEFTKRSIYLPVVRNLLPDVLTLFDAADPNGVTTLRNDTTVPSQSLFLLNSPLLRDQSRHFAQRLLADDKATDEVRLQRAHEFAFGRPPTDAELTQGRAFLDAYLMAPATRTRPMAEWPLTAWQSYCQALFCQNEFLYVE
jgi:mono/diheme cytochrome c family protein